MINLLNPKSSISRYWNIADFSFTYNNQWASVKVYGGTKLPYGILHLSKVKGYNPDINN